jgi:hypothetical protein
MFLVIPASLYRSLGFHFRFLLFEFLLLGPELDGSTESTAVSSTPDETVLRTLSAQKREAGAAPMNS